MSVAPEGGDIRGNIMKTKITAVALLAVTAGVFAYTRPHNALPSDLRDAVADSGAVGELRQSAAMPEEAALPEVSKAAATEKSLQPEGTPIEHAMGADAIKGTVNPKIFATPVTANWPDVILLKFNKGTDINIVTYVLKKEGLSSTKFSDNGDGFYVRLDIKDSEAAFKAQCLAGYAVVEAVEVNRNVLGMIAGTRSGAAPAPKSSLKAISEIMAAGPIPEGCVLEVNAFNSSPFAENLNIGIIKGGAFTDILMSGDVPVISADGSYKYEAVSTEGAGVMWQDHRVKNVFELRLGIGNSVAFVTIEKYKETKNIFGKAEWKKTSSVTCKN